MPSREANTRALCLPLGWLGSRQYSVSFDSSRTARSPLGSFIRSSIREKSGAARFRRSSRRAHPHRALLRAFAACLLDLLLGDRRLPLEHVVEQLQTSLVLLF